MATGKHHFEISDFVNPKQLGTDIELGVVNANFWGKFFRQSYVKAMGKSNVPTVGSIDDNKAPSFSGAPIEVVRNFEKGGTDMDVAVKLAYFEPPAGAGAEPFLGTGEPVRWLKRSMQIWKTNKAFTITVDGSLEDQINRDAIASQLKEGAVKQGATQWKSDWTGYCIEFAMNYGQSPECCGKLSSVQSLIPGARTNFQPFSHGNTFVAGRGLVWQRGQSNPPGSPEYEDNLAAAITAMRTKPVAQTGLNARTFREARRAFARIGGQKLATPHGNLYVFVAKDSQYDQLEEDKDGFRNELLMALPRDVRQHPFFGSLQAVYQQTLIYVNPTQHGVRLINGEVGRHGDTLNTIMYGPANPMGPTGLVQDWDTSDVPIGWFIDAGMLTQCNGKVREKFTLKYLGHDESAEWGCQWWQSFLRSGDVFDGLGHLGQTAGTYVYNTTSLRVITNTPYEGNYGSQE